MNKFKSNHTFANMLKIDTVRFYCATLILCFLKFSHLIFKPAKKSKYRSSSHSTYSKNIYSLQVKYLMFLALHKLQLKKIMGCRRARTNGITRSPIFYFVNY